MAPATIMTALPYDGGIDDLRPGADEKEYLLASALMVLGGIVNPVYRVGADAMMADLVLPAVERHGPIEAWIVDDTGFPKKGRHSVGVARQYCGSVGKIANGQVGVYLGYASRKGYSLVEGQLFMPAEWFDETHTERWQACGAPEDLTFKTKPEIGLELLQKAQKRGNLPFSWVAADELYGDSPAFRDGVDALGKWYFTEIKSTTPIWRTRPKVRRAPRKRCG